jgi:hypothetical protein
MAIQIIRVPPKNKSKCEQQQKQQKVTVKVIVINDENLLCI